MKESYRFVPRPPRCYAYHFMDPNVHGTNFLFGCQKALDWLRDNFKFGIEAYQIVEDEDRHLKFSYQETIRTDEGSIAGTKTKLYIVRPNQLIVLSESRRKVEVRDADEFYSKWEKEER